MIQAKNIVRHSVVEYNNTLYMIETNFSKGMVLLIPKDGGIGKQLKSTTELNVVKYPAQLALEYLNQLA